MLKRFSPDACEWLERKVRPLTPELVDRLVSALYDDLYQRKILTIRERHIATLSALVAMGDTRPQLRFQMLAAFHLGFTRAEIEEILIQNSVFSGFSRAMNAAITLKEVHDDYTALEKEN